MDTMLAGNTINYNAILGVGENLSKMLNPAKSTHKENSDSQDLKKFYQDYIFGRSLYMLELGNDIISSMRSTGMAELDTGWAAERWGESAETVCEAVALAEDFEYYTFWHQSVTGHAPEFIH